MNAHRLARITILLVAVAALSLSCTLDYMLDFELTSVSFVVGGDSVLVNYKLTNNGFRSLKNAAIKVEVTAQDGGPLTPVEAWTPYVDLSVGESVTGSVTFTFTGFTLSDATAVVVGAGWDDDTFPD
jgi:hypothetical protein